MKTFAIVGIGRMGGTHADNLIHGRIKNSKLIAVADIDEKKTSAFVKAHGEVRAFKNVEELLSAVKPDAVIVATPHYSHVPIVCYCLEHGVNVLSEKPVAVTVSDAQRAIDAAKKHPDLLYGIMFNQRTNRMYMKAKELISSGKIGEIKRITLTITDWYRSQHYYDLGDWRASWNGEGGGLLINQCVHQLDILQWLVGMPKSISAKVYTKLRDITVENDVVAVMEYPNNARCIFTANGHELAGSNLLEIAGDKGKISIGKTKMKYILFEKSEREVNATTKKGYGDCRKSRHLLTYGIGNALKEVYRKGQQATVIERFAEALEGGRKPVAYGEEGINALMLINGIYLSSYRNKSVDLPIDFAEYDKLLEELKQREKANK